jgi:hypothetical protein
LISYQSPLVVIPIGFQVAASSPRATGDATSYPSTQDIILQKKIQFSGFLASTIDYFEKPRYYIGGYRYDKTIRENF